MNLTPYKFSDNEFKILKTEYLLIKKDVNLSATDKNTLEEITGVYFWLMNYENQSYKIYIGRTNSLKRRLYEYKSNFQKDSPNDFKLRFFQDFINKHLKVSSLDLYFMECSKADYKEKEKNAIKSFNPTIVNMGKKSPKTSVEIEGKIQQAHQEYYEDIFLNKLNK